MKLKYALSTALLAISLSITAPAMADDWDTAMSHYDNQNYNQAFSIFKRLAEQGNASAQYNLGVMYEKGLGVKQDDAQAVWWYQKSAEQGYADAQFNLGNMYYNGQGIRQSHANAMTWWKKAYTQGHAKATYNIGILYDNGDGVHQNKSTAKNGMAEPVIWAIKVAVMNTESLIRQATDLPLHQIATASRGEKHFAPTICPNDLST